MLKSMNREYATLAEGEQIQDALTILNSAKNKQDPAR